MFKKISCKDRMPEDDTPVIAIYEDGVAVRLTRHSNGYWFLYDDCGDADEPDYWLEEIEEAKQ